MDELPTALGVGTEVASSSPLLSHQPVDFTSGGREKESGQSSISKAALAECPESRTPYHIFQALQKQYLAASGIRNMPAIVGQPGKGKPPDITLIRADEYI